MTIPDRKQDEVAFHGDNYLLAFCDYIFAKSEVFIETGTYQGHSTEYIARTFNHLQIFSCEPNPDHFKVAKDRLHLFGDRVILSSEVSPDFLYKIIEAHPDLINKEVVFWLDAHPFKWDLYKWPLKEEIRFITKTFKKVYIFVDDFKNPGRPDFHFNTHRGQEYSYESIRSELSADKVYSVYFPTYKEKTSRYHPLVGWILIEFGHPEMHIPALLQNSIRKASCQELLPGGGG